MKKLLTVLLILVICPIFVADAQVPNQPGSAMIFGPIYDGEVWSFQWGGARKMSERIWFAALGDFGKTAEVNGEVIALYAPIHESWAIGPMIGMGADMSDEPGTEGEAFVTVMTKTAGVVSTWAPTPRGFLWGFVKNTSAFDNDDYNPGWTYGIGVGFRL